VIRRVQRNYDWFGYGLWFVFGAVVCGLPVFVFHVAVESAAMGKWQLIGLLTVCCLGGGLYWGRKHRRAWELENAAGEVADEISHGQI